MRVVVGLLGILFASSAFAGSAAIDRELTQQQLQTLAQQIAIAQQQLEQSPGARTQLAAAVQQLAAAQTQVGELLRQVTAAPPARGYAREHEPDYHPPPPQVLSPMGDATLRTLVAQISNAPFASDKLDLLRQATLGNYFLVDQVVRLIPLFVHSSDRIAALQLLAPLILDRPNNFKIIPLYQFAGDRAQAQKILESAPPLAR
ncbi:MAG TPA: DUF4476 domain-containing protein [Polyangia bacterium]|nr:DUF4476 domain-containing protein [Polyangia bacterium]